MYVRLYKNKEKNNWSVITENGDFVVAFDILDLDKAIEFAEIYEKTTGKSVFVSDGGINYDRVQTK